MRKLIYLTRQFNKRVIFFNCRANYSTIKNSIKTSSSINNTQNTSESLDNFKQKLLNGPNLKEFLQKSQIITSEDTKTLSTTQEEEEDDDLIEYIDRSNEIQINQHRKIKNVYFEVYGCQMNVSDTEVAYSILNKTGSYTRVTTHQDADVIFLMTCSIREGAEQRVWSRLQELGNLKNRKDKKHIKIGLLGCMAERLKEDILDKNKSIDIICGPDAYRKLPDLLDDTYKTGTTAMNVQLSLDETYADVNPLRISNETKNAFISIQRGCNNMCSFCIVPFVRGRERSRPIKSILDEIKHLNDTYGIKDVTLLGQNVNSYCDTSEMNFSFNSNTTTTHYLSKDFKQNYKNKSSNGRRFVDLLDQASLINPEIRLRFTSPHPKDFPDNLLELIKVRHNICKHIHLPAQSGSTTCLERMRRGYSREAYINLVHKIRSLIPNIALTSDFISGFCGETEQEHQDTISLIELVKYNFCFTFPYSLREKTKAFHRLKDDVPIDVKSRRHNEVTQTFRQCAFQVNKSKIGEIHLVLVEGDSKRSSLDLAGRNDNNTMVIFEKVKIPFIRSKKEVNNNNNSDEDYPCVGDYVACKITDATSQTLRGLPLYKCNLSDFYSIND